MTFNNLLKRNLILVLFALIIFLVHLLINRYTGHLNFSSELIPIHVIIYALCAIIYNLAKFIAQKHKSNRMLVVLGSISAKMMLALGIIVVFYLLKENNVKPFILSFFIAYIIYLPVISYIFIKDFK